MKKNLVILVVMLSMLLACTLTACTRTCIDGHTLVDVEVKTEPTCDVVGSVVQKCSVCNTIFVNPIPALGHTYGEWSANEDGLTHSRVCATDNSHIQTAHHVDADGDKICDDCSFEIATIDPSTCQHQWANWTYNNDGTHTGVCTICGTSNTNQVCSGGNATCTEAGVCEVCGGEYLPATDEHVYAGEVTTPAGCETVGEMTYTCQCGDSYTEEIPATGHAYGEWAYNNDGTHSRVCANDATHVEMNSCSGGVATCTNAGLCEVCDGAYIPALDHKYPENWTNNGENHIKVCENDSTHVISENHTHVETDRKDADCDNGEVITMTCQCGNVVMQDGDSAIGHNVTKQYVVENGVLYWTEICTNGFDCSHVDIKDEVTGVAEVSNADDLKTVLENGYSAKLTADIEISESINISSGDVSLDLNGYDVVNNGLQQLTVPGTMSCSVFVVSGEATEFTITGEGNVVACPDEELLESLPEDIEIIVSTITAIENTSISINGGTFEGGIVTDGSADIEIVDGTFIGFNPGDVLGSGMHSIYNAETDTYIVEEHNFIAGEPVAPTCTEDGYVVYTCVCGSSYTVTTEEATGHTTVTDEAVAPTCTETGLTEGSHCSVCDTVLVVQVVVPATGHTAATDKAVAPTCTETGLTEGSHCSVCDAVLVAQVVVPATGHTTVTDEAVAPTCTATGLTEGSHCSVCSTVLVAQEVVPATGHTTVTDEAVAPACTETGLTEGSHCSACGTVFVAQEVVSAKGHEYEYVSTSVGIGGKHNVYCYNCNYRDLDSPCFGGTADCENRAVCKGCGSQYGEALGHDYSDTWTNNGENHSKVCENDESHILTEEHNFVENGRTPANCENAEVITYTCICGAEKTENGENALGHSIVKEYVVESGSLYWTEICTNECECNHDDVKTEVTGVADVATAKDLKTVLENGFSAKLTENITLTDGAINITSGEVKLDLNGFDITSTGVQSTTNVLNQTLYVCDVFVVSNGATRFTIVGSGTVSANPSEEALEGVNENNLSVCVLSALDGAYVKIDGGVYHSTGCTVIYARTESRVDIFDGRFIAEEEYDGKYYTLDVWEGEHADISSARINVYGGTFVNFNPANHSNDGGYTSKVVELYSHVVEIEDDEYGKVYLVEAHNISDNAEWTQPMCSVCGICFSYRFNFVDGDIIYLLDDCPGCSDIGNGLIFILEAVAGEDEVFYIRDSYSDLYVVFDENNELTLSKEKTENSKFRVYADITVDDKYVLYFVGVGFEFETTMEDDFAFISYCENHNVILEEIGATCTTRGGTAYACEHCGLSDIFDYLSATGHDFEAVVTEPKCCGGEGYTTYTCKNEGCGYSYIDEESRVPALECELSWKDNGDGTCTERCYLPCTKQSCNGEVINGPLAHNDDNIDYACDRCSAHVHKYTTSVVKATCEEGGYTLHTCDGCNDSYKTDEIIALDHDFSEPVSNCDGTHTSTCLRDECGKTATVAHSISQDDSIYCVCGMIMVEKAYSVEIGDVIVLVHMDGDTLKTMDIDFIASSTSALYLRVSDSAHQESYLLMTESGECLMRKSETAGRLSLESKITDEYRANWIISIAEDGAVSMRTVYNGFLGVDEYGIFCFNYPTDDSGSNGLVYYIYKLKSEDSFGHTWSKWIPNDDRETHTRTCSTCGIQETNEHNYVVINATDATCESAGMLVYACECKSTYIEGDDDKPKLGHEWSAWSRGDATNAQHSRECSRCSKTETEVCSVDKNQRLGYIVSDGVNGKLIAAQYICTICNELANKVCDEEIIPVANEAELRAAISAGRSVIFENDIHVTSTIDIDCELTGDITLDLASWILSSYNCALFYIYDSDGQSQYQVTIKNGMAVLTEAENMSVCCPIAIVNNEVKLIIESGEFENLTNNELFVVRNHAELWIKGGSFTVAYDGFSGVNDAFCSEHNGVIDLIDETGVDSDGSAYCSLAEFYGWEYDREDGVNGTLVILDGSHVIGGNKQGDYEVEYCQYDSVVTEPGCCQANGYTTYTCKVCGYSYTADRTNPVECVEVWTDNGDGTCSYGCNLPCGINRGECIAPWSEGPYPHVDENDDMTCDNCGVHIHNYVGTVTEPTCLEDGYTVYDCDRCGHWYHEDGPERLGHDFTKYVDNEDGTHTLCCSRERCKAVDGEPEEHVDTDSNKLCDSCGADLEPKITEIELSFATTEARVSQDADKQVWVSGELTLTNSKHNSTTAVVDSSNPVKFYKNSKLTIECDGMTQIVFTCNSVSYANDFASAISAVGYDVVVNEQTVTVKFSADVFEVDMTVGQIRVNSLVVTTIECKHSFSSNVTAPSCTSGGYTTDSCSNCGHSYKHDFATMVDHADLNDDGICDGCLKELTQAEPKTYTYTFSQYTAGTQYAADEKHELDDNTTITTTECHFTSELRIYSSSANNGFAVIHSEEAVSSISVNAGYKADTIVVYVSEDGKTWKEAGTINVTTSYKDYILDLGGSYKYIKLDVKGSNQVRLKSLTLTF